MNLREQLRQVLPDLLPTDPAEAVKGTELIRLVRLRLGDDYSDATLRYHFSILSYDPSSPIAKVDQGQGYYQRSKRNGTTPGQSRLDFFEQGQPADFQRLRFERVLAIFERLCLLRSRYPFVLNGRHQKGLRLEGDWEVPDLVCAEWELDTNSEDGPRVDIAMLDLRRHLGGPEVMLSGVQLKLGTSLDTYSADFFQALSSTRWTLQSELIIADPLNDEALVDALRHLGHQYGVGITSLGITGTILDDLPPAADLRAMGATEFEAVQNILHLQKISIPAPRSTINWQTLSHLRKKHETVAEMVGWLGDCLDSRQPDWAPGSNGLTSS